MLIVWDIGSSRAVGASVTLGYRLTVDTSSPCCSRALRISHSGERGCPGWCFHSIGQIYSKASFTQRKVTCTEKKLGMSEEGWEWWIMTWEWVVVFPEPFTLKVQLSSDFVPQEENSFCSKATLKHNRTTEDIKRAYTIPTTQNKESMWLKNCNKWKDKDIKDEIKCSAAPRGSLWYH